MTEGREGQPHAEYAAPLGAVRNSRRAVRNALQGCDRRRRVLTTSGNGFAGPERNVSFGVFS